MTEQYNREQILDDIAERLEFLSEEQLDEIVREYVTSPIDEKDRTQKMMVLSLVSDLRNCRSERDMWRTESLRKYPTPDAYDAACAALEKHRQRADKAEGERDKAISSLRKLSEVVPHALALEDVRDLL